MKISILTLFPEMFCNVLDTSILGRARAQGLLEVNLTDIRAFSSRKHKNADDYPFGGGAGMVMLAQPVMDAMAAAREVLPQARRIYLGPRGHRLTTSLAHRTLIEGDVSRKGPGTLPGRIADSPLRSL